MDDKSYNDWKKQVSSHPAMKQRGDIIINERDINKSTRQWRIIRDSILIFLVFMGLLLFSVRIFYPDNYKDILTATHICEPNLSVKGTDVFNNLTCSCGDNVCPDFPTTLIIKMENSTT